MREKVLPEIEISEDIKIYRNNIPWQSFPFNQGYRIHYMTDIDKLRSWNVSVLWYNSVDYDDILFLINNVQDPWNMPDGYELKIPFKQELDIWLQQFTV